MEAGGLNLYGFCRNNSTNLWDYLGMTPIFTAPTDHGDTSDSRQIEYADEGGFWRVSWYCNGGTDWYAAETVFVLNAVTVTPGLNDENVAPPIDVFGLFAGTGDDDFGPNSGGSTIGTVASALGTAASATGSALSTVGSALSKVGGILWDHRDVIGAAVVKGLDDEEVKIKVQFDATVYGPIVGSQSLSRTAGGVTTYEVEGQLGGGLYIAGGEEFRLLGQKGLPSNWSLSGNFGAGGSLGLKINMMDWRPTSVLMFVGVGLGGSLRIQPPSVATRIFEATIDNKGEMTNTWGPGP